MKIRLGGVFALFLLVMGIYIVYTAATWPYMATKLLPIVIGSSMAILALKELMAELLASKRETEVDVEQRAQRRLECQRFAVTLGWVGGIFVAIYLAGMIVAAGVISLLYLKTHGRSWIRSTAYGIGVAGSLYALFVVVFDIPVYQGLLFSLLE